MIKYSAVATAVVLATGFASLHAAPETMVSATFTMRSPGGNTVGTFPDVTGFFDSVARTWGVASPSPFFGVNWTAHDGVLFGPGTYNIPTVQPDGAYTGPGFTNVVVGAGQVGGHILFDYGPTLNIDVINVWDESCVTQPTYLECTYTSIDGPAGTPPNPDGIPGYGMLDGAFPGWNAAFDFVLRPPLPGAPTFTPPVNVDLLNTTVTATPATIQVALGTVTDEAPGSAVVQYSIDGLPVTDPSKFWIADNDPADNFIDFTLTQTVNTLVVDWRASNGPDVTTATQKVTITIDDKAPPNILTYPPEVPITLNSSLDSICFGTISSDDAIDPTPLEQWSLDGTTWVDVEPNDAENCSTGFGVGANTVFWRVSDASDNTTATYQQPVYLTLPPEMVGKQCVIDLGYAGFRDVVGRFTMRGSNGALVGSVDNTVTGDIDTTVSCSNADPAVCNPNPSAASLVTQQEFYQFLWTATPIRLFGPGTWTFEACLDDGSTACTAPTPLSMTVKPGQLGAHMLFDWAVNKAIDVAVVWDVNCSEFELTATDPDGDGILGTPMVDGPFNGFNAAFDVRTTQSNVWPPIADGGYTTTIPVAQNPVGGKTPWPFDVDNSVPATKDDGAIHSCVGGCFGFSTNKLLSATDTTDADNPVDYQYAQVVLPLTKPIPFWSQYRKFDNATWGPFTIDGRNDVKTAPTDSSGACPEPGNGIYDRPINGLMSGKLRDGDECVQLTIEDNGPNDSDPAVGTVADPGGVAEVPDPTLPEPETSGGGCSLSAASADASKGGAWWLLAGFLTWLGWKRRTLKTR